MMQKTLPKPEYIIVTEEYRYRSKVSGVREMMHIVPTGLINMKVPYDSDRHSGTFIGHLHCGYYGTSNLDRQPGLGWERDLLPVEIDSGAFEFPQSQTRQRRRFDLQLKQNYFPAPLLFDPLEVSVGIVDDDSNADESDKKNLPKELQKQANFKRSLRMVFRVKLSLPYAFVDRFYEDENPIISKMRVKWPIATPYRLANVRVGSYLYPPIKYNPEWGTIEWNDVPLKLQKGDEQDYCIYWTDKIFLKIGEPIEFYENLDVAGCVSLELKGLLSELSLNYLDPEGDEVDDLITERTVFQNDFTFNLKEGLQNKNYSPRQHLHFPGVVLNERRVADVIMLLEDRGFESEIKKLSPSFRPEISSIDEQEEEEEGNPSIEIEATRAEGARKLVVNITIEGQSAETTRKRTIEGDTTYTTPFPVGATGIYLHGKLQGDPKRIVSEVNEIQKQLKEQFRHVGTAE